MMMVSVIFIFTLITFVFCAPALNPSTRAYDQNTRINYIGYFTTKLSQADAKRVCAKGGSQLITIKNTSERKFVENLIPKTNSVIFTSRVWLGLRSDTQWLDGTPLVYSRWKKNVAADGDCFVMDKGNGSGGRSGGKWQRVKCNRKAWFICEKR